MMRAIFAFFAVAVLPARCQLYDARYDATPFAAAMILLDVSPPVAAAASVTLTLPLLPRLMPPR